MSSLTEEEALNAVAYISASAYDDEGFLPDREETWESILEYEGKTHNVAKMWQSSRFNEFKQSIESTIHYGSHGEWLVYASYDEKMKFMKEAT